jgi:hypothetical protein
MAKVDHSKFINVSLIAISSCCTFEGMLDFAFSNKDESTSKKPKKI